ncbi:MAG: DUF58 domain-containing protein [Casimicrobium sp.]
MNTTAPSWWAAKRADWRISLGRQATFEDEIELVQRRIYVLPTTRGLFLIVTAILLLLVGINYQLSLAYVVAFLLGGFMQAALLTSYRNLRGLIIKPGQSPQCQPLENLDFVVSLRSPERTRAGVMLSAQSEGDTVRATCSSLPADDQSTQTLRVRPLVRGIYKLGRITIETRAPYGVIRAWSYAHFEWIGLAEPLPEHPVPTLPLTAGDGDDTQPSAARVAHDPDSLRDYVAGDSLRRVAWKQVAKSGTWYTRASESGARREIDITWDATGKSDDEEKLSRLAAWVLRAQNENVAFALSLPNGALPLADGAQQHHEAKRLLAAFPHRLDALKGLR